MKFWVYHVILSVCTLLVLPVAAQPAALAPYTDNPLVEFLAQQRYHAFLSVQADTASNDHDVLSLIGGIGYFPLENLSVGVYGLLRNSDRQLPQYMRQWRGFGFFSEYNLAPQSAVQPFGGLRLGFIDLTGPGSPTTLHAAALGGIKFAFNRNVALSLSGVFNWTDEEILNYKQNLEDRSFKASNTDVGIEMGLRLGF